VKWKYVCAIIILIVTLFLGVRHQAKAFPTQYGPRSDLQVLIPELKPLSPYGPLYRDLVAGRIDICAYPLNYHQYLDAISNPDIFLMVVPRYDLRCWSLNNNQTIAAYPGVDSIMSHPEFRKALWCLSNVSRYVQDFGYGFAEPVYVPVAAPSGSWNNQYVVNFVKANYACSLTKARAFLDAADIKDIDGDGIRNYPHGWPGAGDPPKNLDGIVFYARKDDPLRLRASQDLVDLMEAVGIPIKFIYADVETCYKKVMGARDYHIYSAGWSTGRFPTYQYGWFHTSRWMEFGSNYHVSTTTGHDRAVGPGTDWQAINAAVEKIWYAKSFDEAIQACKDSQLLSSKEYACVIPLWSTKAPYAYRNLLGVCNMYGVGPENIYTYMNAKRIDDPTKPIRIGLKQAPTQMNPIFSRSVWDDSVMDPTLNDGQAFQTTMPYNRMIDQPWAIKDWTLTTWDDHGVTKSLVTYWIRDNINWIEPVTGNIIRPYTLTDYEWNCWYYGSVPGGWTYTGFADIHHIRTYPAENKVVAYMDVLSCWSQYWPYGRDVMPDVWKLPPLSDGEITKVYTEGTDIFTPGDITSLPYLDRGSPVEITQILVNDVPLTKSAGDLENDYEIVKDRIHIYKTDIPDGATVKVTYWARGDCGGYYPGGRDWKTTQTSFGDFYMTDFKAGVGGWATFKANRNYFMETPVWGEVDYLWYWGTGSPARGGYYWVYIFDVSGAEVALGSQGYRIPDINWQPGCDLSTQPIGEPGTTGAGYINHLDLREVLNKIDAMWGAC